mmetsp:Transcript_16105/g.48262  ORF Transcript_16105/g.48262 Transcript_16105/m.48262 type:complete len:90 (-) Transcript_16105:229-498(-)
MPSSFSSLNEGRLLLGALNPVLPGAEAACSCAAPTHPGLGGVHRWAKLPLLDALDGRLDPAPDALTTEKKDLNEAFFLEAICPRLRNAR